MSQQIPADHNAPAPVKGDKHLATVEHEKPEDWGWHHEFRLGRQVGGWFSVLVLLLYLTGWHYNRTGDVAILATVAVLVGGLLWDRKRQRTQWRN